MAAFFYSLGCPGPHDRHLPQSEIDLFALLFSFEEAALLNCLKRSCLVFCFLHVMLEVAVMEVDLEDRGIELFFRCGNGGNRR